MERITLFILCFFLLTNLSAQRMSEEDIRKQEMFISANQLKLLLKYDQALKIYLEIEKIDPTNAVLFHDMARIYLELEDFENAKKYGTRAVRMDQDNIWYLTTLAQINETIGDYADAAEAYGSLLKLRTDEALYLRRAENFVLAGMPLQAIEVYNQAEEAFGKSSFYTRQKVALYLELNDRGKAENEWKDLIKADKANIDHRLHLVDFYLSLGDKKKGKKALEEAHHIDPNHEGVLVRLNELDAERTEGQDEFALFIQDERVGMDPKIGALLPKLESLNPGSDEGEKNSLINYADILIRTYPSEPKVHALKGDILSLSGNVEEAIAAYEHTLTLTKSVYEVWDQLMASLQFLNKINKLKAVSEEAIDYYPNQSGPYYYQAYTMISEENWSEALDMLEEADLIAGPQSKLSLSIKILQARIHYEQGNVDKAIEILVNQEDVNPNLSSEACELLGDLYMQKGEKLNAEDYWKKALNKGGNQERLTVKLQSI